VVVAFRLSRRERETLEQVARHQRGEARRYRRARMVLLAASGESISSIARRMGTWRLRVSQWLRRFKKRRLSGLQDRPRSGRPIEITALECHQVIAAACKSPKDFGIARNTWTHESLRSALVAQGLVRRISTSEVGRILDEANLKPYRIKSWCHSTDPEFQVKMRSIVGLYVRRPPREPVLSIDEKTGMQAISRSRELKPAVPGRAGRFEFDYRRNGTRSLFACFNIGSGQVLGRVTVSHRRPDFFSFMDLVAQRYRQPRVHVILDNLATHKDTPVAAFVSNWNRRHGNRFVFHYTPTHGSWLNQVELWFAIVTRRVLRHGNFGSVEELVEALESFIARWNDTEAHPFRWTYRGLPLVS